MERQSSLGSLQEELESMVECPVHYGILIQPKSLPCGHVICLDCIRRWVEARRGVLVCPECNSEQVLPREGVDGLPNCYRLIHLCEYLGNLNEVASAVDAGVKARSGTLKCDTHIEMTLDRICRDCRLPVCQECARQEHAGHMCLDGSTFMKHMGQPLKKLLGQARIKQKEAQKSLDEIDKMKKELLANKTSAVGVIDQFVIKLIEQATAAGDMLRNQVESTFQEKHQLLEDQENYLRATIEEIEGVSQMLNNQPDDPQQSLTNLPPMVEDATNRLQEVKKMDVQFAPKTSSDIWMDMDGTVMEWFQPNGSKRIGKVMTSEVACPSECQLAVVSEEPSLLSQEVEVELTLNDGHGAQVRCHDSKIVSAEVVNVKGKRVIQVFEHRSNGKLYTKFRPKCIGKYLLNVKVYNQKVKNSPLPILVAPRGTSTVDLKGYPPFHGPHDVRKVGDNFLVLGDEGIVIVDKEGRMVNKFTIEDRVFYPYALAYHNQAYFVTALKGKKVVKFSKMGIATQSFGVGVLEAPTGIAVSKDGTIYVADDKKCCIFVFGGDGKLVRSFSGPGNDKDQLRNPWYIKLNHKGQLVVADCGNCRIQVFNPQTGKCKKSIYVEHAGKPLACRGLDLDVHDNIFVTARAPGKLAQFECVKVYSPDGDALGTFAESPPRSGLHFARGITVIGGELKPTALVVDGGSSAVKFFVI